MMEDFLNYKDLYDPIEGDNAKSSDTSYAVWKKLKKKTLGAIR